MFRVFKKKKRKFSLTFAVSGNLSPFVCEFDGLTNYSQFHVGYDILICGKVNRDVIIQTIREHADKCNNEEEKRVLKYLIEHAVLIAWSEVD